MASMSLMFARSNLVVQAGRCRSFVTQIRFNPIEERRLFTIIQPGSGRRREGVLVRAGLGAFSSAVQRRTRKGGRRRKKRQSQTRDGDESSSSNDGDLAKLPQNGAPVRTDYGDYIENDNSDDETEESPLDQIHADGTERPRTLEASQRDQPKESEGSVQEPEEKIPGQQTAGSSLNSFRLDAMQKEIHSQFVDNLTLSASMQHFLGSTNLSQLQQRTSSGMVQEESSSLVLAETHEIIDPHVFVHSVNSASWYSTIHQVGNHHQSRRSKENHPKTVTGQLLAGQSPSSSGSSGYKSDRNEVGARVRFGAARSKKLPKRKTKGHDVKMDKLMVRKTSGGAEQLAHVDMTLDISVVDAQAPEGVFEDRAHCMEALTGVVNHSNGHIRPSSSSGKVDKSGLVRGSGLLQHERPKQIEKCTTSLQSSVLQTVQDMRDMDRKDVGVLAEDANVSCITSEDLLANGALSMALLFKVAAVLPKQVLKELPSKLTGLQVKLLKEFPAKVAELPLKVIKELPAKVAELPVMVIKDLPTALVENSSQLLKNEVIEPVVETVPDVVVKQVGQPVEQVCATGTLGSQSVTLKESQVTESVTLPVEVVDSVTSTISEVKHTVKSTVAEVTDSVASTAADITESETSAAVQVLESVSSTAAQVSSTVSLQTDNDVSKADGNLPSFRTSDAPEFRGLQGVLNVHVLQEDLGILATIYDFYIFMLKRPLPQFALGMFAAPILLSLLFTGLYLLDFQGLSLDETARGVLESATGDDTSGGVLAMSWTLFQFFMFSLSLSTGLQSELVPVSPYTLVVANINALVAQLMFVFLSGAVFARLSQPSQPVRCSKVALMCPVFTRLRQSGDPPARNILTARFVLVGPQPCELVDVKVDLTYKYNTVTRSGSFFRARNSLKLVRSEVAHLTYGMLVRHIVDETSPLYNRTLEMLNREDAVFTLSVIAVERTSMQCVFHVQHYCVSDADVIWDAEFEDLCLINKKNERIYDHSKLSLWRTV